MTKRFICLLLSAILLLGVLPVSPAAIAWAEELPAVEEAVIPTVKDLPETTPAETPPAAETPEGDAAIPPEDETSADELPTEDTSENDTLTEITAEDEAEPFSYTADSGQCGDNVRWSISGTTLTISGTGAMWNYVDGPWCGRDITSVVIEDGVTAVGECAFAGCWDLQSVTLPRSITEIQYGTFYYCYSLETISLPSTLERIGQRAFQYCGALSSVSLPDSITTVEPYAFSNCWNLRTVTMPKNLQTIGSGAFSYCDMLSSISLPDSVTDIAYFAFGWCGRLSSVKMPERLNSIGEATFYNCYNLHSIDIPQGLTTLPISVFQNSGLRSVTIPEGITRIGRSAFFWCDSLTSCNLPDSLLSIGDYAFEGCYNLRGIKLPSSLQTVGNYSFDDTGISSLTLPTSLRSVGACAFSGTNIFSVTLPANLTYCANSAFSFCSNLESIRVNSANNAYTSVDGVLFNKAKTTLLLYPCAKSGSLYAIPSTVTSIAAGAFETASNLGRVTIPDGVDSIGEMAFAYCEKLASVSIPKTVSSWGNYIFMECYNLKQVTLADGLTTIGAYAFSWSGITTIELPSSIRTINDSAFLGTALTSITLPEGVTELGESAFAYCDSLATVSLPQSLIYIGPEAFSGCYTLETANYAGTYQQWRKNVLVSDNNDRLTNVLQYADSLRLSDDLAQMEGATLTLRSADGKKTVGESKVVHGKVSLAAIADGNYSVTLLRKGYVSAAVKAAVADNVISLSEELTMIRRGNVNGVNDVDITDVQCLYEYLATRVPMGKFRNDTALLRQVGDVNEDGILNILDFEALYQQVVASSGGGSSDGPYRIGIVTGSVSQSEDDRRGAEAFQAEYGEDMVTLAIYPDNFTEELETTIQNIVNLSSDPDMKAIIVNQAVPGTTEAFRKIKESRPDIICIAGEAHEDLPEIGSAADLVCNNDFVSRGYLIIRTAHELGCDTFVHISFPRHMAYETMSRRVAIMKAACEEFGMKFVLETAPDPTSDVGVSGAQAYILEKVPEWVNKYGKNAAYFCTNDAHTEPLLKQLLEYGGYYIESDLPSPLLGYPGALGLDLTEEAGNPAKILRKVEAAICEKGGAGHFGTWAYPYGYTLSAGLAQHAKNVIDGNADICDMDDVASALQKYSPKAEWNGASYTNATTGVKSDNVFLIYQDTYIMGNPGKFMGNTSIKVPQKYFTIS